SRFALLRWSHDLRRALNAATADESALEPARRHYLVLRVAEHIGRTLDQIPDWHGLPSDGFAVIEPSRLADALKSVPLSGDTTAAESADQAHIVRARVVARLEALT